MPDKPETPSRKNQTGLWIGFFAGLALLIVSFVMVIGNPLGGWQGDLFRHINNASDSYRTSALWVTQGLGSGYAIAACLLVPAVLKKYRTAWRFLFTTGVALVTAFILKYAANEPRPVELLHNDLHLRAVETGPTFPSGHMVAATALALTLWFILPPRWRWLGVVWLLIVAWSRIYVGVHTPADIISGFAVGLMAVCAVRLLPPKPAKQLKLDEKP